MDSPCSCRISRQSLRILFQIRSPLGWLIIDSYFLGNSSVHLIISITFLDHPNHSLFPFDGDTLIRHKTRPDIQIKYCSKEVPLFRNLWISLRYDRLTRTERRPIINTLVRSSSPWYYCLNFHSSLILFNICKYSAGKHMGTDDRRIPIPESIALFRSRGVSH